MILSKRASSESSPHLDKFSGQSPCSYHVANPSPLRGPWFLTWIRSIPRYYIFECMIRQGYEYVQVLLPLDVCQAMFATTFFLYPRVVHEYPVRAGLSGLSHKSLIHSCVWLCRAFIVCKVIRVKQPIFILADGEANVPASSACGSPSQPVTHCLHPLS